MAHWIIEDYGFGGERYECSNCKEVWSGLFNDCGTWEICENCGEFINQDENEYVEIKHVNKEDIQDIMIKASNKAGLTRDLLLDTLYENGVLAIYNIGMKHMYEYLKK